MKYKLALLIPIAFALTACGHPGKLSPQQREAMVKRHMDRCLAEGIRDQTGLIRCTLDKMCCSAPTKQAEDAPIFDASTGKMLTGNAAVAARRRANRQN